MSVLCKKVSRYSGVDKVKETQHNTTKKRQFRDSKTKEKQFKGRENPKDEEESAQPVFFMQENSH